MVQSTDNDQLLSAAARHAQTVRDRLTANACDLAATRPADLPHATEAADCLNRAIGSLERLIQCIKTETEHT